MQEGNINGQLIGYFQVKLHLKILPNIPAPQWRWLQCKWCLYQMRKHRHIFQSHQAVCLEDSSELINDRKQRGTAPTVAVKVKSMSRLNWESQGRCRSGYRLPASRFGWRHRCVVIPSPSQSNHTQDGEAYGTFSRLGENVGSNLSFKPLRVLCQQDKIYKPCYSEHHILCNMPGSTWLSKFEGRANSN